MKRLVLLALVACKSEHAPPQPAPAPKPAPAIDRDALLAGKLPEGEPMSDLVFAQCQVCHTTQYLTQQRLAEPAWKKTIDKMRRFGANLTDDQAAQLAAYAARYWNPDLPGRTWSLGPLPAGALPIK